MLLARKSQFDYNVSMKNLIIVVLILILIQTTSWEEIESLPFFVGMAENIGHTQKRLLELEEGPKPTPYPTATPVIVRQYER